MLAALAALALLGPGCANEDDLAEKLVGGEFSVHLVTPADSMEVGPTAVVSWAIVSGQEPFTVSIMGEKAETSDRTGTSLLDLSAYVDDKAQIDIVVVDADGKEVVDTVAVRVSATPRVDRVVAEVEDRAHRVGDRVFVECVGFTGEHPVLLEGVTASFNPEEAASHESGLVLRPDMPGDLEIACKYEHAGTTESAVISVAPRPAVRTRLHLSPDRASFVAGDQVATMCELFNDLGESIGSADTYRVIGTWEGDVEQIGSDAAQLLRAGSYGVACSVEGVHDIEPRPVQVEPDIVNAIVSFDGPQLESRPAGALVTVHPSVTDPYGNRIPVDGFEPVFYVDGGDGNIVEVKPVADSRADADAVIISGPIPGARSFARFRQPGTYWVGGNVWTPIGGIEIPRPDPIGGGGDFDVIPPVFTPPGSGDVDVDACMVGTGCLWPTAGEGIPLVRGDGDVFLVSTGREDQKPEFAAQIWATPVGDTAEERIEDLDVEVFNRGSELTRVRAADPDNVGASLDSLDQDQFFVVEIGFAPCGGRYYEVHGRYAARVGHNALQVRFTHPTGRDDETTESQLLCSFTGHENRGQLNSELPTGEPLPGGEGDGLGTPKFEDMTWAPLYASIAEHGLWAETGQSVALSTQQYLESLLPRISEAIASRGGVSSASISGVSLELRDPMWTNRWLESRAPLPTLSEDSRCDRFYLFLNPSPSEEELARCREQTWEFDTQLMIDWRRALADDIWPGVATDDDGLVLPGSLTNRVLARVQIPVVSGKVDTGGMFGLRAKFDITGVHALIGFELGVTQVGRRDLGLPDTSRLDVSVTGSLTTVRSASLHDRNFLASLASGFGKHFLDSVLGPSDCDSGSTMRRLACRVGDEIDRQVNTTVAGAVRDVMLTNTPPEFDFSINVPTLADVVSGSRLCGGEACSAAPECDCDGTDDECLEVGCVNMVVTGRVTSGRTVGDDDDIDDAVRVDALTTFETEVVTTDDIDLAMHGPLIPTVADIGPLVAPNGGIVNAALANQLAYHAWAAGLFTDIGRDLRLSDFVSLALEASGSDAGLDVAVLSAVLDDEVDIFLDALMAPQIEGFSFRDSPFGSTVQVVAHGYAGAIELRLVFTDDGRAILASHNVVVPPEMILEVAVEFDLELDTINEVIVPSEVKITALYTGTRGIDSFIGLLTEGLGLDGLPAGFDSLNFVGESVAPFFTFALADVGFAPVSTRFDLPTLSADGFFPAVLLLDNIELDTDDQRIVDIDLDDRLPDDAVHDPARLWFEGDFTLVTR